MQTLLSEWGDRKVCERRQLESLIGTLNHACKVVRCGRSFLRRMLDLLHRAPAPAVRPYLIRLNRAFRSDLMWWHTFAMAWNGVSFLLPPSHLPQLQMASDASGSWGCGAWHGRHWFQLRWDERSAPLSIMAKELLPIVLAVSIWGPRWGSHRIIGVCDNQAVVACCTPEPAGWGISCICCAHWPSLRPSIHSRSFRDILIQRPITWPTTCPEITSLLSV